MSKIHRALGFSVLTQYSIQIISLVSIAILARLLTPAEIGVFAIASSLTFLATELRAVGVGQFLVREKQVNEKKIRSATGLMICMSWGLAAIIALNALAIADFYDQPALAPILWIIAPTFLLAPFASVPSALLNRNMQFQQIFVVKLLASIVRNASTIIYVLLGYSYYGLALGILTGAVAQCAAINYFRPAGTPWLPSFSGVKSMIQFGLFVSSSNLLQRFAQSIPDLVLGRITTMTNVGLFSRGLGLIFFLNKFIILAVRPVILPHFSKVKRGGGSVADAYLKTVVLQAGFCLPLFAVINLASYPMIRALFGDQWDLAVPIASILAIWAIPQSIHYFSSQALIAVKEEKIMFIKEVIVFLARFVAVTTAAPFGLEAVAWGMVISGFIEFLVNTWAVNKALGLKISHQLVSFIPTLTVTAACWFSLLLLTYGFDIENNNPWLGLMVIGICMTAVWLIALRLTKHEAWPIIIQMLGKVVPINV